MRLIFMGTPAFAVPTLQALIDSPHEVVAVYSQPPRPAGRGQKLTPSPTHQLAEQHSIPVHTPVSLKSPEAQEAFRAHGADAAIVAAYGLLLPKPILVACPHGCINIHPSDLPRWRGAAPIQRTIMAGDRQTAICIMQMDEGLDTGAVLLRAPYDIPDGMTAGQLHDVLAMQSPPLLLKALEHISAGTATLVQQAEEGVTYAHKIEKEEARIDWSKPAQALLHHIHGMSPFPGAFCELAGERWKILRAELAMGSGTPGTVLDDALTIACGEGALRVCVAQRPGKAAMAAGEILRGFPVARGTVLS
jgi:methionyl-tRNA formyltransferase